MVHFKYYMLGWHIAATLCMVRVTAITGILGVHDFLEWLRVWNRFDLWEMVCEDFEVEGLRMTLRIE